MVYRVYVEKKEEYAAESAALRSELVTLYGVTGLTRIRVFNRYDAEHISPELFREAESTVFSEPQTDIVYREAPETGDAAYTFAVEYLPGQYDQRADSAAQCIQIISQQERPTVRTAKLYALYGSITEQELETVKRCVINPVEAREASLELPETLEAAYPVPPDVEVLTGFSALRGEELDEAVKRYGLAMDRDDLEFFCAYFASEQRDPTLTELRLTDTYWSDHCRHTTFLTEIDAAYITDPDVLAAYNRYAATRAELGRRKPVCLMDIATVGAKYLKSKGMLDRLDESEEINACTVKITVEADGKPEKWLLLFKNETHNHPTEIEPFGGAATCIGGAIRDPLSGRAYVYAAMRVTGAANPTAPVSETLPGKLPQRKIVTTAAAGYSSYGNQIGLATGEVHELYHPGYAAKRLEIGAVIGAAPEENVRRETPEPGDAIILLGGRTGRDGCGGATGSSKSHTHESLASCGAEVQKGNAPEERKLQRLFRNPEATLLVRRCNDFGAGGVSVAVGELADGLTIDLDKVKKKYDGLDGTELAISESQERMAVVVAPADVKRFLELADGENLEATVIARVEASPRLVMLWRGKKTVDLSREFLNSNGARKHIRVAPEAARDFRREAGTGDFRERYTALLSDLNVASQRGLSERFDSTIGGGTVLMPFGGKNQRTPSQAMVHRIPTGEKHTDDCSFMSWGFNPYISEKSPYHGAYLAVVESLSRLVAAGAEPRDTYLTLQEYFEKPKADPARWGKPFAALLGAFAAQLDFGVAAIGGKDSMSGSFDSLDVPPTLVSFAVTTGKTASAVSPEFKGAGHNVVLIAPDYLENGLPDAASQKRVFSDTAELLASGTALSAWSCGYGGIAEGVYKCCIGNGFGFEFDGAAELDGLFSYRYGAFICELADGVISPAGSVFVGRTTCDGKITRGIEALSLDALGGIYEKVLESVYPTRVEIAEKQTPYAFEYNKRNSSAPAVHFAVPRVLIPVFPGTNCEYDSARAVRLAGAEPEIVVLRNLSAQAVAESAGYFAERMRAAQAVFIPGGFSGGDEPDGSGKFITAFFRNERVSEEVGKLLEARDGLMCGICNGFQALIKLGLVPYGRITPPDAGSPTLTYNTIGRHQSKIVYTRVASVLSPWFCSVNTGEVYAVPVSHGEGRFVCSPGEAKALAAAGQIATQYATADGVPCPEIEQNPNGSYLAVEGITSPDGRVLGKMGHCERTGAGLMKNVPGNYDMKLFESLVRYYSV